MEQNKMNTAAISGSLLSVGLLIAGVAAPANASAAAHDGKWIVSVVSESGTCRARYTVPIRVEDGQVTYAGAFRAEASGRVNPTGKLKVSFSHKEQVLDASGSLQGRSGYGSWKSPTKDCAGTWMARKA